MRVITGSARGRRLKEPTGNDIRPTTDQVKESVFNILQFDIEGRTMLDLFGGTGQMGIEALSRGAKRVTFVDSSQTSVKLIRDNLKTVGFENNADVIQGDSVRFLDSCGKYDIIYIDPPYASELYGEVLNKINKIDILKDNGIIVCESLYGAELPQMVSPYRMKNTRKYGKIAITVYTKDTEY